MDWVLQYLLGAFKQFAFLYFIRLYADTAPSLLTALAQASKTQLASLRASGLKVLCRCFGITNACIIVSCSSKNINVLGTTCICTMVRVHPRTSGSL